MAIATNDTASQGALTEPMPAVPQSIDDPPLSVDEAAALMTDLGFLACRVPPDAEVPDSCLMVVVRDAPTNRHFDPETATFWVVDGPHGRLEVVDRGTRTPFARRFSWGTIRLTDRFGARNELVTFGGRVTGTRIGPDATLLIFGSAAPILRLGGHSQPRDQLADAAAVFFRRLVTRMWSGSAEVEVGTRVPAEELWAAFLLHEHARFASAPSVRESAPDVARAVARALEEARTHRPESLAAGRRLLDWLDLAR